MTDPIYLHIDEYFLISSLINSHAASKDHKNSNEECVFLHKHDLKSVGTKGLFSLINVHVVKRESSNLLSNHM